MALKLVVLDMDGVLIFSKQLYLAAFRKEFAPYGIEYTERMLDEYTANPANPNAHRAVVKYTLPAEKKGDADKVADRVEEFLAKNWRKLAKPAPGAKEAVEEIKAGGVKVAVATHASYEFAVEALKWAGVYGLLDLLITGKDGFADKSDALKEVMMRTGVKPGETVYVGDVMADCLIAKKAGCRFVGFVGSGFNTREQLASVGAKIVIEKMGELPEAVRKAPGA